MRSPQSLYQFPKARAIGMETLTPAQRVVVTIVVLVLTAIAVAILLPLLNRAIESWLEGEGTPSPSPAASPTPAAASAVSGAGLTHLRPVPILST
jgi:hypothetical protein